MLQSDKWERRTFTITRTQNVYTARNGGHTIVANSLAGVKKKINQYFRSL